MHQNGHGMCGGCSMTFDRCAGGRAARKADGWSYTGRDVLGWVCRLCRSWARGQNRPGGKTQRAPERSTPPNVEKSATIVDKSESGVRGFGSDRADASEHPGRLRNRRRRATQRARRQAARTADLDSLSPSAYAIHIAAEQARKERRAE